MEAKVAITGIESLFRLAGAGEGLSKHMSWLDILTDAMEELPKGCQGKSANRLLAKALDKSGLHLQCEFTVSPGSAHSVDFLIQINDYSVGVELGTGQAERVELDLLKLINLALRREINCACLILPRNVMRHSVMGTQEMLTAVKGLARMCSPLFTLIRVQLKDIMVVWYD